MGNAFRGRVSSLFGVPGFREASWSVGLEGAEFGLIVDRSLRLFRPCRCYLESRSDDGSCSPCC